MQDFSGGWPLLGSSLTMLGFAYSGIDPRIIEFNYGRWLCRPCCWPLRPPLLGRFGIYSNDDFYEFLKKNFNAEAIRRPCIESLTKCSRLELDLGPESF